MLTVAFSGSYQRPSRTRVLVEEIASCISRLQGGNLASYDVQDLGPSLGTSHRLEDLDPAARGIVQRVLAADILVVGSPVYKGSYTGLFKHLFDLLEPTALAGKTVALAATGGSERHALVIEHQLRPLFGFFATHSAPTGIYATDRDFAANTLSSDDVRARIEVTAREVVNLARP